MLVSNENICVAVAKMIQNRCLPKVILLTEETLIKSVYISKHFAMTYLMNEFKTGLKLATCAHFMHNTLILKMSKKTLSFVKAVTTTGTVFFIY